MALVLDLPPKLILPDYYQASRPAIIRPEGSFSRIGLPIEASLPGIAALVWGGNSEAAPGQQVFTATSTSWVVPDGVTSISALCVGHGGQSFFDGSDRANGGRGGDLRYAVTLAVTPGETLTIAVPAYSGNTTTPVSIKRGGTTLLAAACGRYDTNTAGTSSTIGGDIGGGNGGSGGTVSPVGGSQVMSGGGAGGYSGNGGAGNRSGDGSAGSGGGGGGGRIGRSGGGVGLLGAGSNGAGGTSGSEGGKAGSGGSDGSNTQAGAAGAYGGGGSRNSSFVDGTPGAGAVRIIWGAGRAYPSTNTGDV